MKVYRCNAPPRPAFSEGIPADGDKDPELFEIFDNFALGEVFGHGGLDATPGLGVTPAKYYPKN